MEVNLTIVKTLHKNSNLQYNRNSQLLNKLLQNYSDKYRNY